MRLDKYLKVTRVIKRRTVANEISSNGRVTINGKSAKPGSQIKAGDIIEIKFGYGMTKIRVLDVAENVRKADTSALYEIIEDTQDEAGV
ncbi:MAG: RNA-binding S4 domain-containing protein [Saccharofermentanales bacterium]